jgi:hypothetical protein
VNNTPIYFLQTTSRWYTMLYYVKITAIIYLWSTSRWFIIFSQQILFITSCKHCDIMIDIRSISIPMSRYWNLKYYSFWWTFVSAFQQKHCLFCFPFLKSSAAYLKLHTLSLIGLRVVLYGRNFEFYQNM